MTIDNPTRKKRTVTREPMAVVRGVVVLVLVLACLVAIVVGQRTTSWTSLGVMLLALGGLIALLAGYNRKFR